MLASNEHAFRKKVEYLFTDHSYIDHCTYLGFGLLEAPCECVLHGPLLGMHWLRLCPHFGAPTLEAMLLRRRLFIFLMIAAHISPTSFPFNCPLLAYWASYFNTITPAYILYITFTSTHLTVYYVTIYYTAHTRLSCIFISSTVHGRLAALDLLCPIQEGCLNLGQEASK